MAKKKQLPEEVAHSEVYVKDFFDMIVPSTVKFNVDHYICGDSYRCVWAIKEYPPQTSDQAILSRFGDKEAVTLHLYTRFVDGAEQRKILQNASRKNKMLANSNDIEDAVTGEGKLLTKGNTAASIDELYLFLTNLTAIEYIRNASKRVRKKDSSILLASQNIEDFLLPEVKEMTKPLFSIPTHQFLFNAGNINPKEYISIGQTNCEQCISPTKIREAAQNNGRN